jgi:hypothetical protein
MGLWLERWSVLIKHMPEAWTTRLPSLQLIAKLITESTEIFSMV